MDCGGILAARAVAVQQHISIKMVYYNSLISNILVDEKCHKQGKLVTSRP